MQVEVAQCDWGGGQPLDIKVLLTDVAAHITRLLRKPVLETIAVEATPDAGDDPITLIRSSPQDPFRILLSARDTKWSKFAYQFSHELCHVLSGYERLEGNPNNWFHEAICELASVFTLRRMAEGWYVQPPYPNWAEYAQSLASYAEDTLSREARQLPRGMSLRVWLLSEEEGLRKNRYLRDKNAVVAYSLLPIFENDPAGWNAVRRLPDSSATFGEYLFDWHTLAEPVDKPFVRRILDAFS